MTWIRDLIWWSHTHGGRALGLTRTRDFPASRRKAVLSKIT